MLSLSPHHGVGDGDVLFLSAIGMHGRAAGLPRCRNRGPGEGFVAISPANLSVVISLIVPEHKQKKR